VGIGLNTFALGLSEKGSKSSTDFNEALFLDKKNNSLTKINGVLSFSLIGIYKIKVGELIEKIENCEILTERNLPIGVEVGYRLGKGIDEWMVVENLINSPQTNLSGYFLTLKISGMYKKKFIKSN
jgi:hypothetical protein